jgi:hypothetical protein
MSQSGDTNENLSRSPNMERLESLERSDAEDARAAPADGNQGRGGRDGIIPANNMAIVPVHHLMDINLFEKIVVCDATALSAEDQALTNDAILSGQSVALATMGT